MRRIELIYDPDCPNIEAARDSIRQAMQRAGLSGGWQEWNRSDPESPDYVRQCGSPTILVDGMDAVSGAPAAADSCRLYHSDDGVYQRVPSAQFLELLLRRTNEKSGTGGLRAWLVMLPAIGVALLPKLACPACWPAYAGLLGSIGLGFLVETTYLLPCTAAFLIIAVGALGFRAQKRHGYGPFLVGLMASGAVIVGKFVLDSDPAMYGGIAMLIAASIWNTWPKRTTNNTCQACAMTGKH